MLSADVSRRLGLTIRSVLGRGLIALGALGVLGACETNNEAVDPCTYPREGCPCNPSLDRGCCIDWYRGLECTGGPTTGFWQVLTGCPCVDQLDQCGGEPAPERCPNAPDNFGVPQYSD